MPPKFGTSGLRGLVTDLTEGVIRDYVGSFLLSCETGEAVYVGWDLRPSSPQIAEWVMQTVADAGLRAFDCGPVPTPALALASLGAGAAAVMVTGSHIPSDRNGLKFYTPAGEITKSDEGVIRANSGHKPPAAARIKIETRDVLTPYRARYTASYAGALAGKRIGVYQHSSVARDLLVEVLHDLGADAVAIARTDSFTPVDTEAVDPETIARLRDWFDSHHLDVLVSTDGDGDRPMVVDEACRIVPGDVLGLLTAQAVGADVVCMPVSANTQIDSCFSQVARTRIGSPFVIEAMERAQADRPGAKIVGFEPNGGFLLGFAADGGSAPITPLKTRDSLLPIIAPLALALQGGETIAGLVDRTMTRFTATDRVPNVDPDRAGQFLAEMSEDRDIRDRFLRGLGKERVLDETDGLRMTLESGDIVHLRRSGNAPEFRCYVETSDPISARDVLREVLKRVERTLLT